ncbi:MAG: dihydrolipoamide acetyltransferase family protein [Thermodesulfobacteriota bacterium]
MPYEFKLPDLGEGIVEGEIVKWHVKEGDPVEEHQVVAEVETDKAIVEVPTPKKGKVLKLCRAEGDVLAVGETLFVIEPENEVEEEGEKSVSVVGTLPTEEEVLATPKVRSLAKKLGVDLKGISGTGPGGAITEDDVRGGSEAARKEARDRFGPVERVPMKGVRKSIARNLKLSQERTAFVTGMDDADVTRLWDLREREKDVPRLEGVHLTFMPFFMKAVQHALVTHERLNGSMDEDTEEIVVKKYYNIGVAVDTPDGLMVSVVREVDKKTILDLARELQELSKKARERKITLDELKGSTFTISNFGTFGGVYATPIINYPDVAILGTGKVKEKPWVVDGKVEVRKILPLSLTFDHRVVDGGEASAFLNKIISYLEDPGKLFIESS